MYYRVVDGEVVEGPRTLSTTWRNISGLNLMSAAQLKILGWLPEDRQGDESFDASYQTRTGPTLDIQNDKVVATYVVTDKSLADVKAARKAELRSIFDAKGSALVADYAPMERETWPEQSAAAEAYQADPNGSHPFLEGMTKTGESVADLATLILTNRATYQAGAAALIKVRRDHEAAIDAAADNAAAIALDLTVGWPF